MKQKEKEKNKKGQIAGEVIIYILAILIFALILTFGYREITKLMQKQEKIDLINFENNLREIIEDVSASYGDVKDFSENPLKVGDYNKLCFVELGKEKKGDVTIDKYPLIYNSWQDNIKKNVFLVKTDMEYSFYVSNITIDPENSICILITDGKITNMKLEGVGGSAKVY